MPLLPTPIQTVRTKNRFTVWLIALLFIAPVALAFLGYFYSDHLHLHTVNKGQLITPPRAVNDITLYTLEQHPLSWQSFAETLPPKQQPPVWQLVYFIDTVCEASCLSMLTTLQQIHRALGKKAPQVGLVIILAQTASPQLHAQLQQQYPGFAVVTIDAANWHAVWQPVAPSAQLPNKEGVVIVDRSGHMMMSYPNLNNPKDILNDLQKVVN